MHNILYFTKITRERGRGLRNQEMARCRRGAATKRYEMARWALGTRFLMPDNDCSSIVVV